MWRTLSMRLLFVVLQLSHGRRVDVIFYITLTSVMSDGMVVGYNASHAVERFSGVFVTNAKTAPFVVRGEVAVLVIEVGFPLRPISIGLWRDGVDFVCD